MVCEFTLFLKTILKVSSTRSGIVLSTKAPDKFSVLTWNIDGLSEKNLKVAYLLGLFRNVIIPARMQKFKTVHLLLFLPHKSLYFIAVYYFFSTIGANFIDHYKRKSEDDSIDYFAKNPFNIIFHINTAMTSHSLKTFVI